MAKGDLIEQWMAEGFLQADGVDDMESVGYKFYNVLLHSSLLQVAKREDYEEYEEYERCVMHDLVHDMASSVLGSSNNADGITRVRYLIQERESSPIKREVAEHLRTLIFRADQLSDDTIFSDFKCLHVLTLEVYSLEELPRSIRKLIHLRNLYITHTRIRHLPDWIGELHHLQTLRAPYTMEKLPSTIKYLINLRHLHVSINVELPAEIGRLTSLQTLPAEFIVQDKNGFKIEELGSLNNLKGSLGIKGLEKVLNKEEAEKANLSKKSKLSELRLEWASRRGEVESINDENVLEGLQPHSNNLKKLQIWGFKGKRFPEWTLKMAVRNEAQGSWIALNQLVEIEFYNCRECEEIPMLGHLPNLKFLSFYKLRNVKSINSSFYGIGKETGIVFPKLETLELCDMDSLTEWAEVESGSTSEVKVFPHLQSLTISNCNKLMKAPTHFSSCLKSLVISETSDSYLPLLITYMRKLTSLTYLDLEELNELESLPDESFYNNPNLSYLEISKCPKLREIPDGLQTLNSLTTVELKGLSNLINLPRVLECLAKSGAGLTELRIVGVPKFMATSVDQVWHFPNLRVLKIDVSMEGSILQGCNYSLAWLSLTGMEIWEYLPESIQYFTSLTCLELNNFGMEELPEWFDQYISSLTPWFSLKLCECKRLRRLPSTHAMGRLIENERVHITRCPELITCAQEDDFE